MDFDYMKKKWKQGVFIFAVASVIITYGTNQILNAASEQKSVNDKLTEIVSDLRSPDLWLRNYLVNNDMDSLLAKSYSQYPKGVPRDSNRKPLYGIPHLNKSLLPELGEYRKLIRVDSLTNKIKILDTLWNFRGKKH